MKRAGGRQAHPRPSRRPGRRNAPPLYPAARRRPGGPAGPGRPRTRPGGCGRQGRDGRGPRSWSAAPQVRHRTELRQEEIAGRHGRRSPLSVRKWCEWPGFGKRPIRSPRCSAGRSVKRACRTGPRVLTSTNTAVPVLSISPTVPVSTPGVSGATSARCSGRMPYPFFPVACQLPTCDVAGSCAELASAQAENRQGLPPLPGKA